jgi:hypothetical protein
MEVRQQDSEYAIVILRSEVILHGFHHSLPEIIEGLRFRVELQMYDIILLVQLMRHGVGKCTAHLSGVVKPVLESRPSSPRGLALFDQEVIVSPCDLQTAIVRGSAGLCGLTWGGRSYFVHSRKKLEPIIFGGEGVRIDDQALMLVDYAFPEVALMQVYIMPGESVFIEDTEGAQRESVPW